jgi:hypothetical protein
MDVISYGVANQAGKEEGKTRTTLGSGVEGTSPHVKERINKIEQSIGKVTEKANKLIVNDTINIMKANAKFNAIAKSSKYKMHNMIFDDLLDLSGIDTAKSSGYTHDAVNGLLKASGSTPFVVETKSEVADIAPTKVVFMTEEKKSLNYSNDISSSKSSFSWSQQDPTMNAGKLFMTGSNAYPNWWYAMNLPAWVTLVFNSGKVISQYALTAITNTNSSDFARSPRTWTFEGSHDGATWVTLDTRSNISWTSGERKVFAFDNSISYKHYRLYVTASHSSGLLLRKLEVMEAIGLSNDITKYQISRDNGNNWEVIIPEELFIFNDNLSPPGTNLKIKSELPTGTQLLNYALTWA